MESVPRRNNQPSDVGSHRLNCPEGIEKEERMQSDYPSALIKEYRYGLAIELEDDDGFIRSCN